MSTTKQPPLVRFGRFTFNPETRRLQSGDMVRPLTRHQATILRLLTEKPHTDVTRDQISKALYGRKADPLERSIDVMVARLRKLIERDTKKPEHIRTSWGVGYFFCPEVEKSQ